MPRLGVLGSESVSSARISVIVLVPERIRGLPVNPSPDFWVRRLEVESTTVDGSSSKERIKGFIGAEVIWRAFPVNLSRDLTLGPI